MLIDVESYSFAIPEHRTATLSAHIVPDDPLIILLAEALHRIAVTVLPVFVQELLVRE